VALLRGLLALLGGKGEVVLAKDADGKSVKTLEYYKPDLFAKGGEYSESNLPKEELEICRKLGIEIVFGVGERLGQSRDFAKMLDKDNK
jgi:hypothetical protein